MFMLMCLGLGTVFLLLVHGDALPGLDKSNSHEEDITGLELDVAIFGDLQDFLKSDCSSVHSIAFDA